MLLASVLFEQVYCSSALSELLRGVGLESEIQSIFLCGCPVGPWM